MKKMGTFIVAILTVVVAGCVIAGCHSSSRSADTDRDSISKCSILKRTTRTTVPKDIASCRLQSYYYTLHGTGRWALHSERVERCADNPERCVVSLFDSSRELRMGADGEPVADTIVVSAEVLDNIKQMIVEAKAWRFKKRYAPSTEISDGWSWGFSAAFDVSAETIAATPEADRARLLRRGGRRLSSSGSNASPDTDLFNRVRTYLQTIMKEGKE